jgi:hypothetical protein
VNRAAVLPAFLLLAPALQAQDAQQTPEAVRRLFIQRLQDRAGLSEPQAVKVVERWQRFAREHSDRQHQIAQLRQRFQDILIGPDGEDQKSARIKPLLEQFLDLRKQQAESKQHFEDDIRAGLTPAQQARVVVTVEELINQIAKVLENRPALRELRKNIKAEEGRPRQRFQ